MFFNKRADNTNKTVILAPVVVPTSNVWDGNDGSWSTFMINVGADENGRGQNFRVLISTSFSATLVPGIADWCDDDDCAASRGVEKFQQRQPRGFEYQNSKAWNHIGLFELPLPKDVDLELWPDKKPNGTYGEDNVGLGPSSSKSLILSGQYVIEYGSADFFMGIFGLSDKAISAGDKPKVPFLPNFAHAYQTIPSKSYGYSAGASYQNGGRGVFGSLVLGGYDQSRFSLTQNTTIEFPDGKSTLIVGVQDVTYRPDQTASPESLIFGLDHFYAVIDSTLPYLRLPDALCDKFAESFGLTYDEELNLYTVSSTSHARNLKQNANIIIKVGKNLESSDDATSITLPYAAFDLEASPPLFLNKTKYFPLKKSTTKTYVLGRAFLQEAYIIVDYERKHFKVAPANWANSTEHIIPLFNSNYVPPPEPSSTSTTPGGGGGGVGGGVIAGIVVGIVVALIIAIVSFFLWKRRHDQKIRMQEKENATGIDTEVAGNEVQRQSFSELDSNGPGSPKPSLGGYYGPDREGKDISPFPRINEMSPESPPVELYSPCPENMSEGDYFSGKPRRRGATRESSNNNTPGTPALHELPGDDGQFQVEGQHFEPVLSPSQSPAHSRGPSDTSLNTNIDEIISASREQSQAPPDRRPSMHQRGPSDAPTIQSESTAVSNPTPEELNRWAEEDEDEPRRPLSE